MKTITIIIAFATLPFIAKAQTEPTAAPLNPEFIKYMNSAKSRTSEPTGYIPAPCVPQFSNTTPSTQKRFPVVYDLRQTNSITCVKNQGDCGTCWVHGSFAAIESNWKLKGYGSFDLSEDNVNNCHGYAFAPCKGGNFWMVSAYLGRGDGPVWEYDDPYSITPNACPSGLPKVSYITDTRFYPNTQTDIKQAIIDNGGVGTSFFFDSVYAGQLPSSILQPDFTYYYDKTDSSTNHIVCIVGWDDNKVTLAPSPGAWIIKNSYGTSFGEKGYFYVSYQDKRINTSAANFPNRIPVTANTVLYCYDKLGWVQSYGYSTTTAYGLSKFTAASSQKITKIGTYVGKSNGTVDIEVYGTFSGGVLSNLLGTITTKTCPYPGHYYFDLPTPISITGGSDFYVKVKYFTPGYNWPVPVESIYAGFSNPTIETGKCWISSGGTTWTAVGTGTSGLYDMTIKAYAELQGMQLSVNLSNPTVCESSAVTLTANVTGGTPAYSYSWSNSATTSSITVNPSISTTYTVTVSDAAPSTVQGSISVFAYPFSQLTMSRTDETCASCNNGTATANATGNVPFAYIWSTNPVQITKTATNLSPGTYTVTVYDKYDCPMVDNVEILSYSSVLELHGGSFIQVYPNPNEGNFTISVNTLKKEMLNIEIFNVLGEIVYSENCVLGAGEKSKEISLKEYGKGIYFLKLDGNTNNFTRKIIYE